MRPVPCEVHHARDRSDQTDFSRGDKVSGNLQGQLQPIHKQRLLLPQCHECPSHSTRVPLWYLRPEFDNYTARTYRNVFLGLGSLC